MGTATARYSCPVTQIPFDGMHKFVAIWSTGFVLSERALLEIGIAGLQTEYGPFSPSDVVGLLPSDEELHSRRAEVEARLEVQAKSKTKRRRMEAIDDVAAVVDGPPNTAGAGPRRAAPSSSSTHPLPPPQVKTSSALASSAKAAVAQHEEKSNVYKTLFHTDAEAKTSSRDLLMSVAGFRYTLS